MELIRFIGISLIDYLAAFYLMFRLFSFHFKWYVKEIIFTCTLLTFVSYSMRFGFDLGWFDPFVQYVSWFLLLWLIFKIQPFYAIIMTSAYTMQGVYQFIIFIIFSMSGMFVDGAVTELQAYLVVLIASSLTVLTGYVIHIKNWRVTFVPTDPVKVHMTGYNLFVLSLVLIQIMLVGPIYKATMQGGLHIAIPLIIVFLLISIFLLFIFKRKEYEQ